MLKRGKKKGQASKKVNPESFVSNFWGAVHFSRLLQKNDCNIYLNTQFFPVSIEIEFCLLKENQYICEFFLGTLIRVYDVMEYSLFAAKRKTTNENSDTEQAISIIPNPTTNQTLLRWETDIDRIEIISESSQRVRTFNVSGLQQKIVDMSTMPSGVYFMRFEVDNSIVATKKLIKR